MSDMRTKNKGKENVYNFPYIFPINITCLRI